MLHAVEPKQRVRLAQALAQQALDSMRSGGSSSSAEAGQGAGTTAAGVPGSSGLGEEAASSAPGRAGPLRGPRGAASRRVCVVGVSGGARGGEGALGRGL